MTQEEKAKAYDEALEKAKQMLSFKRGVLVEKQALEKIFPELAESEDEKIRKSILSIINQYARMCEKEGDPCEASLINNALAYLEKQKESNHKYYTYDDLLKAYSDGNKIIKSPCLKSRNCTQQSRKGGGVTKFVLIANRV